MINYVSEEIRANNVESHLATSTYKFHEKKKRIGKKGLNNAIPFS